MKYVIAIIWLIITINKTNAQTTSLTTCPAIMYEYDAGGNRISRNLGDPCYVPMRQAAKADSVGIMTVKVYPNPVSTHCIITIANYDNEPYETFLYTINGELLESATHVSNDVKIEMTNYVAGIYYVQIRSKSLNEKWNIFKND
jgi:hypothetical protein